MTNKENYNRMSLDILLITNTILRTSLKLTRIFVMKIYQSNNQILINKMVNIPRLFPQQSLLQKNES